MLRSMATMGSVLVLPEELCIRSASGATDGGTIRLYTADQHDRPHVIDLVQHVQETARPDQIPGRLYYDHVLIEVRSATEKRLLELLRQAPVKPSHFEGSPLLPPEPALAPGAAELDLRAVVDEVVSFVESDEYARVAKGS